MNKELNPDFGKYADGLMPVIVQDATSGVVLMLGFMNAEAFAKTLSTKQVTFFSRSKQRIWVKGETSGNFLDLVSVAADCDNDTLLVKASPRGPVCHTGSDTCFGESNPSFSLEHLEAVIRDRKENPGSGSYTSSLFAKGINKIAQKVGEEAVELVIESKDDNEGLFLNEAADLMFHYLILLQAKGYTLKDITNILAERHHKK